MISIICVYNDESITGDWLLKSLKDQTVEFELIKIDNTKGAFKSAAEALNYGGKKAKGKYIMFVHQDVNLISNLWLENAEKILDSISDLGIAGVAGMREIKVLGIHKVGTVPIENGIGVIYHGLGKEPWRCNKNFQEPVEVQTLDEQVLIIPRDVFENLKFDGKICAGWHLYGVDYCLSVKQIGFKSYVLPLPVCHLSTGPLTEPLSESYYVTLNRIIEKHKKEKIIYTTCGLWYTNNFFNCLGLFTRAIRSEIGRWIGRNNVGASPYIERIKLLLGSKNE